LENTPHTVGYTFVKIFADPEWVTTQRSLTVFAAILVGVPTAYDEYWSKYYRARSDAMIRSHSRSCP